MILFSTFCCENVNDYDNLNHDSNFVINIPSEPVMNNNHKLGNHKDIDDYSTRSYGSLSRSIKAPWPMLFIKHEYTRSKCTLDQ